MKITSILENTKQDRKLTAKHGLSLYIETDQMNIIFDTGPDGSYIKNAKAMGIDLSKAHAVVISHGHSDHIGGLSYLNEVNKEAQIYLSEHSLEPHWLRLGGYYHKVGAKKDIQHSFKDRLNFVAKDMEIAKGIHIITLNPANEYTKNLYKGSKKELDDFNHEIMLVIENKNGIVLFSGCSHHGIIDMANIALDKFPGKKIDVIIGGFHLIGIPIINTLGKSKDEIISIGNSLNEMPINSIYSCHCTGAKGYKILDSVLKEKLNPFPTGKELIIS
ncbi:MBL fold metallo-hydrolase [Paenibacillus dakarensis]|uniref:MBL fold metallo-hydrolase n=1 Tax=Paenibacillus dakarensis TaxID=1527293 RepID=UPI0006D55112|nr:MBL fold metallo-hydrolase [Paenibacillus dakarensis]